MTGMVGGTTREGHVVDAQDLDFACQPIVSDVVLHPLIPWIRVFFLAKPAKKRFQSRE